MIRGRNQGVCSKEHTKFDKNVLYDWFSSSSYAPGSTFRVVQWVKGGGVALNSAQVNEKEKPVRQHIQGNLVKVTAVG
jgi:hypothetical protein